MQRIVLACLVLATSAQASPIIIKVAHVLDGVSDRPRDGVTRIHDPRP